MSNSIYSRAQLESLANVGGMASRGPWSTIVSKGIKKIRRKAEAAEAYHKKRSEAYEDQARLSALLGASEKRQLFEKGMIRHNMKRIGEGYGKVGRTDRALKYLAKRGLRGK